MISFTSVFKICQAKFPENSKSSLVYLTTPMICTRTQTSHFQQQMYCIKSTAELLGVFWTGESRHCSPEEGKW